MEEKRMLLEKCKQNLEREKKHTTYANNIQ